MCAPYAVAMAAPVDGVPFDGGRLSVVGADGGDCTVLVVRGDLDLETKGRLLEAARESLRERSGRALVLDLSGVGYMASVGVAELVMVGDECAPLGVEVRVIVGQSRPVQRLLTLTGLNQVLSVFGSVEDALAAEHPWEA
jgi:anti-sigma B factor antagonist